MSEQLRHLAVLVDRGVNIRVLPMNALIAGWEQTSFTLLDFAAHRPAIYLDLPTCAVISDDPGMINAHRGVVQHLCTAALDEAATGELLITWAEHYAEDRVPVPLVNAD